MTFEKAFAIAEMYGEELRFDRAYVIAQLYCSSEREALKEAMTEVITECGLDFFSDYFEMCKLLQSNEDVKLWYNENN